MLIVKIRYVLEIYSFSRTLILLYKIYITFACLLTTLPAKLSEFIYNVFWPYSSGLFFCRFPSLYRSNSFQFWIKVFFNLHTSAPLIALKLTLSNVSSGSASHLIWQLVTYQNPRGLQRGYTWHFFTLPRAFHTAVIQNGGREGLWW